MIKKFKEWRHTNHRIITHVHNYAELGYLGSVLAEIHSVHHVAVAVLFGCGILHVLMVIE